mmetsp:Transcript_1525/g.2891  ORF Transcript_1525/g.2891 Transcript_1525/m.2891 type:complete len:790 (+) Transcript_1525:17-2386(+)
MPGTLSSGEESSSEGARGQIRDLMRLVNGLRRDGLAKQGIALPQIAVVGDQSSGKSSVLENITGIPFPKGQGTVTKCPTRITIRFCARPNGSFSAKVSFVLNEEDSPFKNEEQETKHASMDDLKDHLERLNEVLNGHKTKTVVDDVIEVEMEYPLENTDVVELSIVDLPGLIATTTEGQSKDLVSSIENMVTRYAEDPRTVILAILEANRDISNSRALAIAEKADTKGERTVGVLTKMDLVEAATEGDLLKVLNNTRKPLKHGYYAVMNRAPKMLKDGKSLEDARIAEREWFDKTPHYWSMKHRCGTFALKKGISTRLLAILKDGLPQIKTDIERQIRDTEKSIEQLGPAPASTEQEMHMQLQQLLDNIRDTLKLSTNQPYLDEKKTLWAHQLELRRQFKEKIHRVRTGFPAEEYVCKLSKLKPSGERRHPDSQYLESKRLTDLSNFKITRDTPILVGEELKCIVGSLVEDSESVGVIVGFKPAQHKPYTVRWKVHLKFPRNSLTSFTYFEKFKVLEVKESFKVQGAEDARELRDEIAEDIRKWRGHELAGFSNYNVFRRHFQKLSSEWREPSEHFAKKMAQHCRITIVKLIRKECSRFHLPLVEECLLRAFATWHENLKRNIQAFVAKNLYDEQSKPMTMNHYFMDTWNKLRLKRHEQAMLAPFQGEGKMDRKQVRDILKNQIRNHAFAQSNEESEAIDLIDGLRAYYKCAKKRYIDVVAHQMWSRCIDEPVTKDLHKTLGQEAFKRDIAVLFQHDEDALALRQKLQGSLNVLMDGLERLRDEGGFIC